MVTGFLENRFKRLLDSGWVSNIVLMARCAGAEPPKSHRPADYRTCNFEGSATDRHSM